jgi:hypothetical protein
MNRKDSPFFSSQYKSAVKMTPLLLGLTVLSIFIPNNSNFAFSQIPTTNNLGTPGLSTLNETVAQPQTTGGFVTNGKINSVIDVPNGKWLATGNWSMILNNGNVTEFETKMTWYNSSGTNAHTHELTNFKPALGESQILPITGVANQIVLTGVSDVGSNNKASWFEVPTTITINDRKIISVSLDDNKTNHHFGGQPLLGIVDSFTPCSDVPGPNMELLPPCSSSQTAEQGFGIPTDNLTFAPSEGSLYGGPTSEEGVPGGIPPGGIPGEGITPGEGLPPGGEGMPLGGIPFGDGQTGGVPPGGIPPGGIPPGGLPSSDQQNGIPSGGMPSSDQQNNGAGIPPGEEQTNGDALPAGDEQNDKGGLNPQCTYLDIENITANGFETDPSDFHPPSDAIDGSSSTWWSYNGDNPWIDISLYDVQSICGVSVQWNKGNERSYAFEIEVSQDGNNYQKAFEGQNKKGSTAPETYSFPEMVNGKFVKLTVTSTSSNDGWASIQEISALGIPLNNQTGSSGIPPGGIPIDNQTTMPVDNQTGGSNGIPPGGIPLDNLTTLPVDNQTGGSNGIPPRGIPIENLTTLPLENLTTKFPFNNRTTDLTNDQNLKD